MDASRSSAQSEAIPLCDQWDCIFYGQDARVVYCAKHPWRAVLRERAMVSGETPEQALEADMKQPAPIAAKGGA